MILFHPRADLCLFEKESAVTGLSRIFASLAVVIAASPALAQNKSAPEITVAHKGAAKALTDLKTLLSLTTPKQRKQWDVIDKNLKVFLIGIDDKRPLKVDLVLDSKGQMGMRPAFPISNIKVFRNQNLEPFGIETRRVSASLYRCKGQVFAGYMRYKNGYAVFAESKSDVPLKLPDPAKAVAGLLAKYDFALNGINNQTDAQSIKERRVWFGKHRKELLALVKKLPDEPNADFELRKLMMKHQSNELERFYAEASKLTTGWKMDLSLLTGRLDIFLTAIPGTPLAKSISSIGLKPSYFASIPRTKDAILSARVNWPLDSMRQAHTTELIAAIKKRELARIDADSHFSKDEKDAHHKIGDIVADIISTNAKAGIFDMFAEVHSNKSDSNTAVGAFRTVDGTKGVDVLKLLPKTGKGRAVAFDVAKVDGVRIHKMTIKLSDTSLLKMFLGDGVIYVGTSKDAIWFASGAGALDELKAAINQRTKPAVAKKEVFIDFFVKIAPWLELRDKSRGPKGKPELRAVARTAFSGGKDGVSLQLRRDGKNVVGGIDIETDVLRFAGAMISKFSEDTLDDSNGKKPKTKLRR